jgi:hypothetical protein
VKGTQYTKEQQCQAVDLPIAWLQYCSSPGGRGPHYHCREMVSYGGTSIFGKKEDRVPLAELCPANRVNIGSTIHASANQQP